MDYIKFIKEHHPIANIKHIIDRKRLRNDNFTILAQNCIGGIIYHNLKMEFLSPTINMRIGDQRDFYRICSNLDNFLNSDFQEDKNACEPYPIGYMNGIKFHFNHYKTFDQAVRKWDQRKLKINRDNVYIIAHDWIEEDIVASKEEVMKWGELNFCKNVVVFTQVEYPDIPFAYYVGKERLRTMLKANMITGLWEFELYWDYVGFLNSNAQH